MGRRIAQGLITIALLTLVIGLVPTAALAQLYSGALTGVVSDPSGAVVVGANVTLTDAGKGFTYNATTDATGRFVLRALPPSDYNLAVEASGFSPFKREKITLNVGQNANVDVTLQVGTAVETVQVTGAAALLATQDSVTGQELNRTFINDLPLINRAVFDLAYLTPGVTEPAGQNRGANNFISNGGRNATADILLDGVTTSNFEQNSGIQVPLYTPSVDAVQEFKVQQSNFTAEIGFSGATVINMITRSGSNEFHGSLYEFLRNQKLDANNFFNNSAGIGIPPLRQNQFGGTIGGPILKDKTFFFFDFEGKRTRSMSTGQAGVPSEAMRAGNFAEICTAGFDSAGYCTDAEQQLWDPYSGFNNTDEGGIQHTVRIPFNNLATYVSPGSPKLKGTPQELPLRAGNLIDPTAQKMMSYYPLPNLNVGSPNYDRFTNWIGAGTNSDTGNQFDVKIDHRFNDNNMLSSKFALAKGNGHSANLFGNIAGPTTQGPNSGHSYLFATNYNRTINPSTLFSLSFGTTRSFSFTQGVGADFPDFDITKDLGMPEYMKTMGVSATPTIYVNGGYQPVGGWGNAALGSQAWSYMKYGNETHHLVASVSKMFGRHDLKIGGEGRMHRLTFLQAGTPDGIFMFDQYTTAEHAWWGGGDAMAGLLIGNPSTSGNQWGGYEIVPATATQSFQYAGYVQDNFRASDRLTLNLGVRYDLNLPRTERFNSLAEFDPGATNPLSGQVPGMGELKGAPVFAGQNGAPRTIYDTDKTNIQPRIGLAFRLNDKTVLRSGYGIFYGVNKYGAAGPLGVPGYSATTNVQTTYRSDGYTPGGRLSNPFPDGVIIPRGNQDGPNTNLGLDLSGLSVRSWNQTPYEQSWSFGIQRELPFETVLNADYVGKKGTHLYFGGAGVMSYIPQSVAEDFVTRPAYYNEMVPNPFYGIITDPNSGMSAEEVSRISLYRQFPQYTYLAAFEPASANSIYNALQVKAEKRFSRGLQFLVTYTWSKSIDNASAMGSGTTWLGGHTSALPDPYNWGLERAVSDFDVPHVFQVSYVWELPFGRGRAIGRNWNSVVNAIAGGWKTNGQWRFSKGMPLWLDLDGGQSIPTYGGQRPDLTGTLRRADNWTLDQYFADPTVAVKPERYTTGTAPRTVTSARSPGIANASLSLFKEFSLSALREGARLEFRAEAFNALNHVQFAAPALIVGQDSFGKISSQYNSPREGQLALKLYF